MKPTVYVVSNNGNVLTEKFETDTEATNYAKSRSHSAFCAIYQTVHNKMFIYENDEIVNAARKAELSKQVEEMILHSMARDVKQGRKSR